MACAVLVQLRVPLHYGLSGFILQTTQCLVHMPQPPDVQLGICSSARRISHTSSISSAGGSVLTSWARRSSTGIAFCITTWHVCVAVQLYDPADCDQLQLVFMVAVADGATEQKVRQPIGHYMARQLCKVADPGVHISLPSPGNAQYCQGTRLDTQVHGVVSLLH